MPIPSTPSGAAAWTDAKQRVVQLPQRVLIALVRCYRLLFKAWLGSACRFEPSCSAYALEALQTHGALRGGGLTARRLLRCHPYCAGGCDPVPPRALAASTARSARSAASSAPRSPSRKSP